MATHYLDICGLYAGYNRRRNVGRAILVGALLIGGVVCAADAGDVSSPPPSGAPKSRGFVKKQPSGRARDGSYKEIDPKAVDLKDVPSLSMEKKGKRLDHEFRAEYSYVGESELSGNTRDRGGKLSEHAVSVGYSVKAPINERFAVEVGVEYDRLDFERPSGSFLPQNLQESSFHVMAQYALTEKWGLFFRGGPSLSLVNGAGVTSDNISFKGMAGAGWRPNDKLMVMAGLLVSQDVSQSFPVLPIASVEWKFAENWELNLGMPKTSLSWQVMPNLRLALIEAQMKGGSYQTAKDYGTKVGLPELNSRNLNYTEIRVGSRIDYALTENIEINLGVGAAVYRKFEFEDLDGSSPNVDPAPYVQAGVKITF